MPVQNADAHTPANPAGARRDDFEDFPRQPGNGRPLIIRAELNPATGRWEVPHTPDGEIVHEMVPFTRASTLGGAIEYQGNLLRWKSAVAVWGVVRSRTLAKRARAVGGYSLPDQKQELYEIVDKAKVLAEESAAASHGTALHTLFQRIVEGETVDELIKSEEIDEEDIAACRAFETAISRFRVLSTETRVVCDEAQAAGKYDAAVTPHRPMPVTDKRGRVLDVILPGERIAVDYKTSSTPDYFGPKFCVQLWIYAHGRLYDKQTGERTENGLNRRWALILHVPRGSDVAEWYWVDLATGEALMKVARSVLEGRKQGKHAITRADLDVEIPPELLEQRMRDPHPDVPLNVAADADQAFAEAVHRDNRHPRPAADDEPPHITEEEYQRQQAEQERDAMPDPGGPHKGDDYDAERTGTPLGRPMGDADDAERDAGLAARLGMTFDPYLPTTIVGQAEPITHVSASATERGPTMQVATSNGTSNVHITEDLAAKLQRSAAVEALLRRIGEAPTLLALLDLYNKADQHGYMSPEVKAACTARKVKLQAKRLHDEQGASA